MSIIMKPMAMHARIRWVATGTWMLGLCATLYAQTPAVVPPRPHILGIAHVAVHVHDLSSARVFYQKLSFDSSFSVNIDARDEIGFVKINSQQYLELFSSIAPGKTNFGHIAFYTDDLPAMRKYLIAQNITLQRDLHAARNGDAFLSFQDPDGRLVEIVEYQATGMKAKVLGSQQTSSDAIIRVDMPGGLSSKARALYQDVLGFQDAGGGQANIFEMRVPDGTDIVEFVSTSPQWNQSCQIFLASGKSLCLQQ